LTQIVKTSDGSDTIFVPELNEHYHSVHGAVQESEHIFVKSGFDYCKSDPIYIFEVGFGTGLNALLTAIRSRSGIRVVNYSSIEMYPLQLDIATKLNHHEFAGKGSREIFLSIHKAKWNVGSEICRNFYLTKIEGDLRTITLSGKYDLIYFDAFGPDKQPDMWTNEIFVKISEITKPGGILLTYSAKGDVKRSLRACGFEVKLLPGPPGKRHIIRAVKK
jgi:tRNA U34 5-methylaminomethyl-2-thiouridine-forming methyltransferase MnmC